MYKVTNDETKTRKATFSNVVFQAPLLIATFQGLSFVMETDVETALKI